LRKNLSGLVLRLTVFVVVCALGAFGLIAIFAQLRFQEEDTYHAIFTSVTGLENGNFVRIAGVEVGKVKHVSVRDDSTVLVKFSADRSVVLTEGSRAIIRYDNLIGGRYLALEEGAGGTTKLAPGETIPLDRTAPALDLDALIGGFRPLFHALDPAHVNALSGQLIAAFQGQGPTIGSILEQTATLTNTLADRDELIGQVVVNLNTVLASLGGHSDQFAEAVDSLSDLIHGLQRRKETISAGLAKAGEGARTLGELLSQAREPLTKTVRETDRAAGVVLGDDEYFDDLLNTLPDAYRVLGRQAMSGDFFNFYLCDLVLKMNGKGGQPVYVKVAGQDTGRCAPR